MADLAKAKYLLDKLTKGADVSMRDLEAALGKDGVDEYESLWQLELESRNIFENKPEAIKRYEELIHAGDFDETKADSVTTPRKRSKWINGKSSGQRLREQSEAKYERAIEYLEEIIDMDGSLRIWFDRDLVFGIDSTLGINRDSVPRTVTSRSTYKLSEGAAQKRSKADLKQDVLERAIDWMENPSAAVTVEQTTILKQKLAALKQNGR